MDSLKNHWDQVYDTKTTAEMSWSQTGDSAALDIIKKINLPKSARIIDVGAGESLLVDHLLEMGYTNITVLDISSSAIEKTRRRLGQNSGLIRWIISDIVDFEPDGHYDLWHDRATFHFLTQPYEIKQYISKARSARTGNMLLSTFSQTGPQMCSGLEVARYTKQELEAQFKEDFIKLRCTNQDHITPFGSVQNFSICLFEGKFKRDGSA